MAAIYSGPEKYIQGPGVLAELGQHVQNLGGRAMVIISSRGRQRFGKQIEDSISAAGCECFFASFDLLCRYEEIGRLVDLSKSGKCSVIVGAGGGAVLDAAKAAAHYENKPVIVCPTNASTDAPCSALSAIYDNQGVFQGYLALRRHPDLVLVDSAVIAEGPLCLTVAGMGDALSTYFEARACACSGAVTPAGASASTAALALAKQCFDTLMADGLKAKEALEERRLSSAVERVIEANTLLSGIGFESGGLAAAHAIHNGMTLLKDCQPMRHGEKVAFATLVQLALEKADPMELERVTVWCGSLGLPITLDDLGITQPADDKVMLIAGSSCALGSTMGNMPFPVTPDMVCQAIWTADSIGEEIRRTVFGHM